MNVKFSDIIGIEKYSSVHYGQSVAGSPDRNTNAGQGGAIPSLGEIRNSHINVGIGKELTIRELSESIVKNASFTGEVVFLPNESGIVAAVWEINEERLDCFKSYEKRKKSTAYISPYDGPYCYVIVEYAKRCVVSRNPLIINCVSIAPPKAASNKIGTKFAII